MPVVKWSTTTRSVVVHLDLPGIHSSGASRRKLSEIRQSQLIRAYHHLVDQTRSVEWWERKLLAPARQTTSVVHQTVGRSVQTMRNVPATVPAKTNAALIRALELVEITPSVRLSTIAPFAHAATASRAIRWCSAIARYHQQQNVSRRVRHRHVDRTPNAESEIMPELATAYRTTKEIRTTCSPAVVGSAT